MASLLDAINAAAAQLQGNENQSSAQSASIKPKVQPKVMPKVAPIVHPNVSIEPTAKPIVKPIVKPAATTKATSKPIVKPAAKSGSTAPKTTPKTDTPKTKGGANYVIPAEFKQAIETYLNNRPDMKEKLNARDKSLEGCCDYIFDVMRKRAEKKRNGSNAVGMYVQPDEIFGLAVHYYDEEPETLKNELKEM